jgi:hypothetical protein
MEHWGAVLTINAGAVFFAGQAAPLEEYPPHGLARMPGE